MAKVTEKVTENFERVSDWLDSIGEGAETDGEVYVVMGVLEDILENGFPEELKDKVIDADLPPLHERLRF